MNGHCETFDIMLKVKTISSYNLRSHSTNTNISEAFVLYNKVFLIFLVFLI